MLRPRRFLHLLLGLGLACGGDPSGPGTGSLAVTVAGLPAGAPSAVTVTGPGGYTRAVAGTITIAGLAPGNYVVVAAQVTVGSASYAPVQPSQTVAVVEGGAAAAVVVTYSELAGSLAVTIAGLPPDVAAAVAITGSGGYAHTLAASATIAGLSPGVYTLTAGSVTGAGTAYTPAPATQSATVVAGAAAAATVTYAASSAALDLRIDGMYLTQSVQTYAGTVPLVKDRDGFLRIFVTATQANQVQPVVRVRFFRAGVLASETLVPAPAPSVPLAPDESRLGASWNLPVPKTLIQPGLSILAEVDPDNTVAESDESNNAFPASGTPLAMDVRAATTFSVRFVPIIQSAEGRQGNVSNANKSDYLVEALKLHPLAAVDADLRAPYTTSAPALTSGNDHGEWGTILSELDALRLADGGTRYYYGVVDPSYSSGVAGIGYVGGKTAVGWDLGGADEVAAHEWGHNWGRLHAPCGGASNPDNLYPYAGGAIGVYGLDVATRTLMPPSSTDLMGYCPHTWISDYTYTGVLNWRSGHADVVTAFAAAMQPCLLVWGRIVDGQPVLEPAFALVTRPSLPPGGGGYRVEGRDGEGAELFGLSFTPEAVADDPRGGEHFAFAVPLPAERAARLALLRLTVPGRGAFSVRASAAAAVAGDVRAARVGDRVALSWDAGRHPMAIVRDPATGEILSFARGGRAEVTTTRAELQVELSTGVASRPVRLPVPGR